MIYFVVISIQCVKQKKKKKNLGNFKFFFFPGQFEFESIQPRVILKILKEEQKRKEKKEKEHSKWITRPH